MTDIRPSLADRAAGFFLANPVVAGLLVLGAVGGGLLVAPFDWDMGGLPRSPVPADALPDIGENQQIVFTEWPGRSPQDVEDQVTYPLTTALLGTPGVATVRSLSFFGFSSIHVVFRDDIEFYWSRSRLLEKLSSLSATALPEGVQPVLGPDATALGQVFWYTLEGRDGSDQPAGGWDPQELRDLQDWQVRDALASVEGVAEVASVGGFQSEFHVDVDPDAMRRYDVGLDDVVAAVAAGNMDVGARTLEANGVEYLVRGRGLMEGTRDLERTVVAVRDGVPVHIENVAHVAAGPALRRGVLDKGGSEAVGGVVVVRHGANPLEVIGRVKARILEIEAGLPARVLADGRISRVTIQPFYDRTDLIHEILSTLTRALTDEVLVTIVVVLALLLHLGSSLVVSALLPVAILLTFLGMRAADVDANVVALAGIAIAIGTMVDIGIVLTENILRHLGQRRSGVSRQEAIRRGTAEVGGAVVTAVLTTVVSFLPVFALEGAEGRLFRPLAYTKTFALLAAVLVGLVAVPPAARLLLRRVQRRTALRTVGNVVLAVGAAMLLARHWQPLGPDRIWAGPAFTLGLLATVLGGFALFLRAYAPVLGWCLRHKVLFLCLPLALVVGGARVWQGLGKEFMPPLDEGTFLFMPVTMPHASIGEAADILARQDRAIEAIPEVTSVVGKIGRVESALDPAPVSMMETVVNYKPEWGVDDDGRRVRQWRDEIRTADDIWRQIAAAGGVLGTTSASKLQPIRTRVIMLQTGMRSPMGVKVFGPDQARIETAGLAVEEVLRSVPEVDPGSVIADRITAKPYLEVVLDREALARHGLSVQSVQGVLGAAAGGVRATTIIEGRRRHDVLVRYQRERRDTVEALAEIAVPAPDSSQVPLGQLADIRYTPGPQVIKSEDSQLVSYVTFDAHPGIAQVAAAEAVTAALGRLALPEGVTWRIAGEYENQVRSEKRLMVVLPAALLLILLILQVQFRSLWTSLLVFSGVFVAWAGGFLLLGLYGWPGFMDFEVFGASGRDLFQIQPLNLSVAVWVGFLALFGIATDDGVLLATHLKQTFASAKPSTVQGVREATIAAGSKRIRPCLMTSATTLLALVPVLTSRGRGADVMGPMAVPVFGGMAVVLVTVFVVPTLWCAGHELALWRRRA